MASSYAISALTAIATFNTGDLLVTVDVTDFTQAPTGTTKKSTIAQLTTFIHTNATFTGTTTVAQLTMTTAASQIIPGATSWAVRNNANSANNLVLTDAGLATFRNTVTISAGGLTTTGTTTQTGSYRFGTDNTFDIGQSAAFRPRDAYIGRNLDVAGALTGTTGAFSSDVTTGGTLGVTGVATFTTSVVVTGSQRLGTSGAAGWYLGTNATNRWEITAAGHLAGFADATYDVGIAGQRVRNVLASGTITATTFVGALTGNASTATTAGTVTTAAQPAITSLGTLTSVTVSGNSTTSRLIGGGSSGPTLTGIPTGWGGSVNGTDMRGVITLVANGVNYTAGTSIATMTFSGAYGTAPVVTFSTAGVGNANNFGLPTTTKFQVTLDQSIIGGGGASIVILYQVVG